MLMIFTLKEHSCGVHKNNKTYESLLWKPGVLNLVHNNSYCGISL